MTNRINTWLANKLSAAYRRKRFRRAAAMRAWYRGMGVLGAIWVMWSVMDGPPEKAWIRAGHVLIAVAYVWLELHYGSRELEFRFKAAAMKRADRKLRED